MSLTPSANDRGVQACTLRFRGGQFKPQVALVAQFPEAEISRRLLEDLMTQVGAKDAAWVLLLDRSQYQFSRVDKPGVADAELEQSLRWLVPLKDVSPQDASISWISVPDSGLDKPQQVYVAACASAVVESAARVFDSAKLELAAVDIREMAQRNIASRIPGQNPVCLLVAEESGVQVTVTRGSDLYLERFIRETLPMSGGADDAAIKRIGIEVRRSLEFVRNTHPDIPAADIVVGPALFGSDLAAQLSNELGQPVKPLDLGAMVDWPAGSRAPDLAEQARLLPLIGACLRL